jgi:mannose-1-phosphate guanylyltransferase
MDIMTKKVNKHWGYELWIADGSQTPYASKRILFLAGNRTSLQVHEHKIETNYVLSGTGTLRISRQPFMIQTMLQWGMTRDQVEAYERNEMYDVELSPGVVFNVQPGYVHRVTAITDLEFMETSTTELDDVIRLQDDQGRTHGRISYEHDE